ncbi:MAG: hypothetical protein PVS3B3_15820 [Ktedonobacteraceae bacterium]
MSTPHENNFLQGVGNFASDAVVDTTADGFINQGIDAVAIHLPGGSMVDQMLKTEVDQVANNAINNEVNKGVGGMMGDAEGLFGHHGN